MTLEELLELTPRGVLRRRFELEAELSAPPSQTGFQLEAARTRVLGPGHNGGQIDAMEDKRLELMELLALTRDLTAQELAVCHARYRELVRHKPYERNVRLSEMREGGGEEVVAPRAEGPDGDELPGYVRVRGIAAVLPSHEQVAEHLAAQGHRNADGHPMSAGAVKRRCEDAAAKVSFALGVLRFKADLEGRQGS